MVASPSAWPQVASITSLVNVKSVIVTLVAILLVQPFVSVTVTL